MVVGAASLSPWLTRRHQRTTLSSKLVLSHQTWEWWRRASSARYNRQEPTPFPSLLAISPVKTTLLADVQPTIRRAVKRSGFASRSLVLSTHPGAQCGNCGNENYSDIESFTVGAVQGGRRYRHAAGLT
uniref:Uncharacterized protein n=1 Tax=Timema tahoe TaxID=61484 RepID=A0A7R9FIH7_9NEOP|nr:unnamed protein product [Timema tahoe]